MSYSEIGVFLLIYGGLLLYFLVPFQNEVSYTDYLQRSNSFTQRFKESLKTLIGHKKALFAFILLFFTILFTWFNTKAANDHLNAHSGYPPISANYQAIYSTLCVIIYTAVLYLLLAFVRTIKSTKKYHS